MLIVRADNRNKIIPRIFGIFETIKNRSSNAGELEPTKRFDINILIESLIKRNGRSLLMGLYIYLD